MNPSDISTQLEALRQRLEEAFSSETSAPGFEGDVSSAGHCAAVAVIVRQVLGGELVSAQVAGHSHWFNRVASDGGDVDIDLTGDQFAKPAIQISRAGALYP